jgi:hypothetical protein
MFGPAAEPMQQIYDTFEYLWVNKIAGKSIDTALGPVNIVPSEYVLWENIYSTQQIEDLSKLFDKAERLAAKDKPALGRVKFIRDKFLGGIIRAAKQYRAIKNELADLQFQLNSVKVGEKIVIDGRLDDKAWQTSNKVYLLPYRKGKVAKVKTVVYGLKDDKYLYFGFDCEDDMMNKLAYSKRKTDDRDIWRDSSVELFLNPSGDRKNYYQMIVNVAGSLSDSKSVKLGAKAQGDWKWNSDAKVKTAMHKNGWSVEIAIPIAKLENFKTAGFPANFNRNRILTDSKNHVKLFTWSPFLTKGFHDLEHFGSIIFDKSQAAPSIVAGGDMTGKVKGRRFGSWMTSDKMKDLIKFDRKDFMVGGQSLKLTSKTGDRVLLTQYLPKMKPNTKYLLTFYIKTDTVVGKNGAFVNIYPDKNIFIPKNKYNGVMPWTKQGFEFTSGPKSNNGRRSYMRLWLDAKGSCWFDDVRIRAVK